MYTAHFDTHLCTGWYYLLALNISLMHENEYHKTFDVQHAKDTHHYRNMKGKIFNENVHFNTRAF